MGCPTTRPDIVPWPKTLVALLVILVLSLTIPSCSQAFRQAVVPPEEIPAEIRERGSQRESDPAPVWRAYYEQGGYDIAVAYYLPSTTLGNRERWAWFVFRNGQCIARPGIGGQNYVLGHPQGFDERHVWNAIEDLDATPGGDPADNALRIYAYGWAWDDEAYKATGTTTQGRTYEGRVVNGYWMLFDLDVDGIDRFETVVVQDDEGEVIRTHRRTE